MSVPGQLLDGTAGVLHGLFFRCSVKGCASDVVLLSPHDVPNPSPSPSHDDGLHAVLIAAGK